MDVQRRLSSFTVEVSIEKQHPNEPRQIWAPHQMTFIYCGWVSILKGPGLQSSSLFIIFIPNTGDDKGISCCSPATLNIHCNAMNIVSAFLIASVLSVFTSRILLGHRTLSRGCKAFLPGQSCRSTKVDCGAQGSSFP